MNLYEHSLLKRVFALIRWCVIKILFNNKVKTKSIFYIGKNVNFFVRKGKIVFEGKTHIHDFVTLKSSGLLHIGDNFSINPYSRIICHDRIEIGENVLIAQFVSILDHDHNILNVENEFNSDKYITGPIKIGNNVWIGDKVTITKGVTIGNNVIIAANSVVVKNIPDNCIYGGIRAKHLKNLNLKPKV